MRIRFRGTVQKDELFSNEDAFYPSELGTVKRVALSDGASESYASQKLARLIVMGFVIVSGETDFCNNPTLWLKKLYELYDKECGGHLMSWSQQGAFERGSFATLLGLRFCEVAEAVNIFGVGDTCAVLLEDDEFRDSVPYKNSADFQQRPELISTIPNHNNFLCSGEFLKTHAWWWHKTRKTIILCMTDALAAWALRRNEKDTPVWKELCNISDQATFETLVKEARNAGEMRIDDSTLLVITFDDEKSDGVSIP